MMLLLNCLRKIEKMSLFILPPGDIYDKRCGEVYLTLNGNIIFHCTLCENKYKGIHEYAVHVIDKHFDPPILDEDCISTHSSELWEEDEINDDAEMSIVKEEFDTVLFTEVEQLEGSFDEYEEEVITVPKLSDDSSEQSYSVEQQNIATDKIISAIDEPQHTGSTENTAAAKNKQLQRNSQISKRPTSYFCIPPKKIEAKPQTVADKIRLVNEEAARCLEVPTFKQPLPRCNIPESERKHKCNFCGFAFKDPSNLIAHIKRHSGKKNFQCTYCSKMFCTRNEIDEHSRRHTGEKPYACNFENCSKSYFTRSELTMHIKRHKNERNFKCEVCKRAFYDRSDLREHFVSHTQERKHECMVCKSKFSRRKALINHMKLHENKREYECNICGASFNQKPGLNSHMRKHKDISH